MSLRSRRFPYVPNREMSEKNDLLFDHLPFAAFHADLRIQLLALGMAKLVAADMVGGNPLAVGDHGGLEEGGGVEAHVVRDGEGLVHTVKAEGAGQFLQIGLGRIA